MMFASGQSDIRSRRGFTLVELLLAISLMLLLVGAVVFSFSSLHRGASLEEGAGQFEALIRFSRAYAAGAGRQVQIQFEEEPGQDAATPNVRLRVMWEPDPLAHPGELEELREADTYVRGLADLVSIHDVRPIQDGAEDTTTGGGYAASRGQAGASLQPQSSPDEDSTTEPGARAAATPGKEHAPMFPPLTFYPDGSGESAQIVLASQDQEEERMVSLQFRGVTGTFHRRYIIKDEVGAGVAAPEAETKGEPSAKETSPAEDTVGPGRETSPPEAPPAAPRRQPGGARKAEAGKRSRSMIP